MSAKQKIIQLQNKIKELEEEVSYLKSPMYHWLIIENIKGTYSVLLSPPLNELHTTNNQKSCTFEISPVDIVCIKAEGKTKWIYFKSNQTSIRGVRFVSDKIAYTGSLESFCKEYDPAEIHLVVISRSVVVNPAYYYLDAKKVKLLGKINPRGVCNNLSIGPQFVSTFVERKTTLGHLISFQKIQFQGK